MIRLDILLFILGDKRKQKIVDFLARGQVSPDLEPEKHILEGKITNRKWHKVKEKVYEFSTPKSTAYGSLIYKGLKEIPKATIKKSLNYFYKEGILRKSKGWLLNSTLWSVKKDFNTFVKISHILVFANKFKEYSKTEFFRYNLRKLIMGMKFKDEEKKQRFRELCFESEAVFLLLLHPEIFEKLKGVM